jgi:hypothetical protein
VNPNRIKWTDELDEQIRAGRAAKRSYTKIARGMGICRNSIIARARDIGLHETRPIVQAAPAPVPQKPRSEPLPAGAAETWGLISDGEPFPGRP